MTIATPQDFGGAEDGDGAGGGTDNTAAFVAAFAATKHVYVPEGIYRVDGQFTLPTGSHLDMAAGAVLDRWNTTGSTPLILAQGVQHAPVGLGAVAVKGMRQIQVQDATGFADGDMIRVMSTTVLDPGRTSGVRGEILFVDYVEGNMLHVTTDLQDTYGSAMTLAKVDPVRDVLISGGEIKGNPAILGGDIAVHFIHGLNCRIAGTRFRDFDTAMLGITYGFACGALDCWFQRGRSQALAYGVSIGGASDGHYVKNCTFIDVRHAVTLGGTDGLARNWVIDGNRVYDSAPTTNGGGGDAIDTHACVGPGTISNNIVRGASGAGINVECPDVRVFDNDIEGCAGNGIQATNWTKNKGGFYAFDNRIAGCGSGAIRISAPNDPDALPFDEITCTDNQIDGCTGIAVYLINSAASKFGLTDIGRNKVRNCTSTFAILAAQCDGLNLSGNLVETPSGSAQTQIRFDDCFGVIVADNLGKFIGSATGIMINGRATSTGASNFVTIAGNTGVAPSTTGKTGLSLQVGVSNVVSGMNNFAAFAA